MEQTEKRIPRSYKMAEKPYQKALQRGDGKLATYIEQFVTLYGEGATTICVSDKFPYGIITKKKSSSKAK